jgi:peptidoglycan/LPS O-acetylase OafA/YrhL
MTSVASRSTDTAASAGTVTRPPTSRRREIDGLRGLAAALVVGYHVFIGRVSGGVDVFLVLTGFFLVQSLGHQLSRTGRIDPVASIVRSLSRLVPAAALVLAVTAGVGAFVLPETRWRDLAAHLISSVTFTENVRLVDEAVDYASNEATTSPMQQFWSLSIQVQVLVVVALVAGAVMWRGPWRRYGRVLAVLSVLAVTASSFTWSIMATRADQQAAYFSTLPRLWELGAGALVALLLVGARPRPGAGAAVGWGSVLALVACGALIDGAHRFPGWQAAWPVLCAVGVLVAGDSGGRFGVHRLLSLPAIQWVGLRSYALYLWHWPVLILFLAHTDRETPSIAGGALVVVVSVVLAAATHRLVELPAGNLLRAQRPVGTLILVAVLTAPLLVAGVSTTDRLDKQAAEFVPAADDPAYPGARALARAFVPTAAVDDVEPAPGLSVIRQDWARLPEAADCTTENDPALGPTHPEVCVLGPDDAARRIVLVGDSHAAHWLPPLAAIAESRHWQLVALLRGGCSLSTESEFLREEDPDHAGCAFWQSTLTDRISALRPDLVVALGTRTRPNSAREQVPPGFIAAWQQLSDRGMRVIAMRDTPRHDFDVPDCLAESGECDVARASVYDDDVLGADLPPGVSLLDTSSYFCTDAVCPAMIGNVRVYMDRSHITRTYMRTVTSLLESDLRPLTGW